MAEESQSAAEQIAALIESMQGQTGRAVDVVSAGARRSDEGVAVVARTREAFLGIDASVEDVAGRVQQIARASQEISANVLSVQDSIAEVAAVVEEHSASSEEVSASSEETSASVQQIAASAQDLAQNAENLNRVIAAFTV